MIIRKTLSALFAATLLATGVQASEPAKQAVSLNADPALWVVKDADTTIYLFGTVHLMKPEVQWFDGGVKAAYDASQEVVFELVEPDPATMQGLIGKLAIDKDGPPLTQKLSPKSAAAYKKAMEQLNVPYASFEQFEPWFVSTLLGLMPLEKYGFSTDSGVEKVLGNAAKRDKKKVIGLETVEEQLGFFDTLPEPLQIKFLNSMVKDLPNYGKLINGMVDNWASGKADKLGKTLNKSMKASPELSKILLNDRNVRWSEWIANRLAQPGTVFIGVGAGHLAGKDSVQAKLKAKKLVAVRIPS